jgi:hypothetical protein
VTHNDGETTWSIWKAFYGPDGQVSGLGEVLVQSDKLDDLCTPPRTTCGALTRCRWPSSTA